MHLIIKQFFHILIFLGDLLCAYLSTLGWKNLPMKNNRKIASLIIQQHFFIPSSQSNSRFVEGSSAAEVNVTFQGASNDCLSVTGSVAGSEARLSAVGSCKFANPAALSGDIILYTVKKETSLGDVISEWRLSFFYLYNNSSCKSWTWRLSIVFDFLNLLLFHYSIL